MDAYKRVIDLLTDLRSEIDFRALGIRLAKDDPETFLRLYRAVVREDQISEEEAWMVDVAKQLHSSDGIVSAIKLMRAKLNIGLKEAKDAADIGRNLVRGYCHDEDEVLQDVCRVIGIDCDSQSQLAFNVRKLVCVMKKFSERVTS